MNYDSLVLLFSVIGFFVFAFFNLPTIYQFQIKEYLPKRMKAGNEDRKEFWIPLKMPAKSVHNLLILAISLVLLAAYFYILVVKFELLTFGYIFFWVLGSLLAKIFAFIGMLLTGPIVAFSHERKISQARKLALSSDTTFIGITGSYGKTSVKEYLSSVLASEKVVSATHEHYNSEIGIALSILQNLEPETEMFVTEMGAYYKGTITKSSSIVNPKYGIITGLGNQHLKLFGSKKNLIEAKSELAAVIPEDGILYLNIDCEGWEGVLPFAKCKVVKYSLHDTENADVLGIITSPNTFEVRYGSNTYKYTHHLNGEHSVLNLLGVIALSKDLGLQSMSIREAVKSLEPLKSKLSTYKLKNGVEVIDDAWNSSVNGFLVAMKFLMSKGKKYNYVCTRGILELGKSEKKESYMKLLAEAKKQNISILTTDKSLHSVDTEGVVELMEEEEMLAYLKTLDGKATVLLEGRLSPTFMNEIEELKDNEK